MARWWIVAANIFSLTTQRSWGKSQKNVRKAGRQTEGRGKSQNHAKEGRLHVSENGEGGLESEASGSLENCPPQAKEVAVWVCVCVFV